MSTQDEVQLSERERQQLAGIKAMLEAGDPRLARVLEGQKPRAHAVLGVLKSAARSCARGRFGARLGRPCCRRGRVCPCPGGAGLIAELARGVRGARCRRRGRTLFGCCAKAPGRGQS